MNHQNMKQMKNGKWKERNKWQIWRKKRCILFIIIKGQMYGTWQTDGEQVGDKKYSTLA